jgi:hypothetical protein
MQIFSNADFDLGVLGILTNGNLKLLPFACVAQKMELDSLP